MWICFEGVDHKVVGKDELDITKIISVGDEVRYYSEAAKGINRKWLPTGYTTMTGKVVSVYPRFLLIRTKAGQIEGCNWWDVIGIKNSGGKRTGDMVLYNELLRTID